MIALPVQAFDEYGFPLDLTPQQAKARQECIAAQRKQEEKWLKYAKAGQLPPMEKLKKLCRKVRQHSAKGCGLEVSRQVEHSQGEDFTRKSWHSTAGRWAGRQLEHPAPAGPCAVRTCCVPGTTLHQLSPISVA